MDLEATFPYRVFTSLPSRDDRRGRLLERLAALKLEVEWFAAASEADMEDAGSFKSRAHRAHATTVERVLDAAIARDADAVLIMEDDVIFAPHFRAKCAQVELPSDWGLCYLGCQHFRPPAHANPGLVRTTQAYDTHAFGIRRPYYEAVRQALRSASSDCVDVRISDLHERVPTYAAYPNLAWQEESWSDIAQASYSNYDGDGRQKLFREVLTEL